MKAENRAVIALVVAVTVAVVVGGVGLYFFTPQGPPPTTLPIPVGTVFELDTFYGWVVYFNASSLGSRLMGTWTAYDGWGYLGPIVVNGSVTKSPFMYRCPAFSPWDQLNETVNVAVGPGPHTLFWAPCARASRIIVTGAFRLVGPAFP